MLFKFYLFVCFVCLFIFNPHWRTCLKGKGEKNRGRKTSIGCLLEAGSNLQPRHMPWLGIKPGTFWCIGWGSNQLNHISLVCFLEAVDNWSSHFLLQSLVQTPYIGAGDTVCWAHLKTCSWRESMENQPPRSTTLVHKPFLLLLVVSTVYLFSGLSLTLIWLASDPVIFRLLGCAPGL